MLDVFETIARQCDLSVPPEQKRAIAVVGAGGIVDVAHVPAYRKADFEVRGIFDKDRRRAEEVCTRHGLTKVYGSLDEVLSDDQVAIVDIAVVPPAQLGIVEAALKCGKHVLVQKPMAPEVSRARKLVELAESLDRCLAVNQQMRYGEGMAAARAMVEAGWIGAVTAVDFHVNISTDWRRWDWLVVSEDLDLWYHSIHYLDSVRALLGDPSIVFCTAGRRPGQVAVGETRTMSTLVYDNGARALLHVNHENFSGDPEARFRIDGSDGTIRGTIGLLYDYPYGRPDTLEVWSASLPTDGWVPYPVTTRWIPDAFVGPMGALMRWAATGLPAPTSGRDNLRTLALVEALYRSIATRTSQKLG